MSVDIENFHVEDLLYVLSASFLRYLGLVTDEYSNYVRLQDRWIAFSHLARGQASVMPTLTYIVQNYNKTTAATPKLKDGEGKTECGLEHLPMKFFTLENKQMYFDKIINVSVVNGIRISTASVWLNNRGVGSRLDSVLAAIGQTLSQTSHIDKVKQMVNDTQLDPSLRKALNSSVLSAVMKRAAWTCSPQAESLKSWIASQTSSAPSTHFSPLLLITIFTLYMATNRRV